MDTVVSVCSCHFRQHCIIHPFTKSTCPLFILAFLASSISFKSKCSFWVPLSNQCRQMRCLTLEEALQVFHHYFLHKLVQPWSSNCLSISNFRTKSLYYLIKIYKLRQWANSQSHLCHLSPTSCMADQVTEHDGSYQKLLWRWTMNLIHRSTCLAQVKKDP